MRRGLKHAFAKIAEPQQRFQSMSKILVMGVCRPESLREKLWLPKRSAGLSLRSFYRLYIKGLGEYVHAMAKRPS